MGDGCRLPSMNQPVPQRLPAHSARPGEPERRVGGRHLLLHLERQVSADRAQPPRRPRRLHLHRPLEPDPDRDGLERREHQDADPALRGHHREHLDRGLRLPEERLAELGLTELRLPDRRLTEGRLPDLRLPERRAAEGGEPELRLTLRNSVAGQALLRAEAVARALCHAEHVLPPELNVLPSRTWLRPSPARESSAPRGASLAAAEPVRRWNGPPPSWGEGGSNGGPRGRAGGTSVGRTRAGRRAAPSHVNVYTAAGSRSRREAHTTETSSSRVP